MNCTPRFPSNRILNFDFHFSNKNIISFAIHFSNEKTGRRNKTISRLIINPNPSSHSLQRDCTRNAIFIAFTLKVFCSLWKQNRVLHDRPTSCSIMVTFQWLIYISMLCIPIPQELGNNQKSMTVSHFYFWGYGNFLLTVNIYEKCLLG